MGEENVRDNRQTVDEIVRELSLIFRYLPQIIWVSDITYIAVDKSWIYA